VITVCDILLCLTVTQRFSYTACRLIAYYTYMIRSCTHEICQNLHITYISLMRTVSALYCFQYVDCTVIITVYADLSWKMDTPTFKCKHLWSLQYLVYIKITCPYPIPLNNHYKCFTHTVCLCFDIYSYDLIPKLGMLLWYLDRVSRVRKCGDSGTVFTSPNYPKCEYFTLLVIRDL